MSDSWEIFFVTGYPKILIRAVMSVEKINVNTHTPPKKRQRWGKKRQSLGILLIVSILNIYIYIRQCSHGEPDGKIEGIKAGFDICDALQIFPPPQEHLLDRADSKD